MAQKVNLREEEYLNMVERLEEMHENQLKMVWNFIIELKILVTSQEIFWANETSTKITDMLDMVSDDVMPLLEEAFQDSETGVASMIESIMATDSI